MQNCNATSMATLPLDTSNQLNLTCQVVQQTKKLASLNVTDYSVDKQIQLQAMNITAAQVKENICDWVSYQISVQYRARAVA